MDMFRVRLLPGLFMAASLAAGCSESSSTPAPPSAITDDRIAGTWTLAFVEPAGEAGQAAPAGASYTLTFAEERLSTRVDCNVCNGAFTRAGDLLTTGTVLACTRAACPTMAFGDTYTRVLVGDSTMTLAGDTLTLSSSRGLLRFTRHE
jgi:heat shock protein HslJ